VTIPLYVHIPIIVAALSGAFFLGVLAVSRKSADMDALDERAPQPEPSLDELRELVRSANNAANIGQQLQGMESMLPVLRANIHDISAETERAALSLADALSRIQTGNPAQREIAIQEGVVALQFQDIVRQKLEHVLRIVEDFAKLLGGELETLDIRRHAEALYTTEAERENHRQVLRTSAVDGTGPKQTRGHSKDTEPGIEQRRSDGRQELGENVELF